MSQKNEKAQDNNQNRTNSGKKPYQKPEFRHEKVFETMALACGKISHVESTCRFAVKHS